MATAREIGFRLLFVAVGVALLLSTLWVALTFSGWWRIAVAGFALGWWKPLVEVFVERPLETSDGAASSRTGRSDRP
jgi:hypothetical protein